MGIKLTIIVLACLLSVTSGDLCKNFCDDWHGYYKTSSPDFRVYVSASVSYNPQAGYVLMRVRACPGCDQNDWIFDGTCHNETLKLISDFTKWRYGASGDIQSFRNSGKTSLIGTIADGNVVQLDGTSTIYRQLANMTMMLYK